MKNQNDEMTICPACEGKDDMDKPCYLCEGTRKVTIEISYNWCMEMNPEQYCYDWSLRQIYPWNPVGGV